MGAFSFWHLLVVLVVVVLVFGTKRLRNVGEDLGAAIKSFRKGMQEGEEGEAARLKADPPATGAAAADAAREKAPSEPHD